MYQSLVTIMDIKTVVKNYSIANSKRISTQCGGNWLYMHVMKCKQTVLKRHGESILKWIDFEVALNRYCRKVDATAAFCGYQNIMYNAYGHLIRFPRQKQIFKDLFSKDKP